MRTIVTTREIEDALSALIIVVRANNGTEYAAGMIDGICAAGQALGVTLNRQQMCVKDWHVVEWIKPQREIESGSR